MSEAEQEIERARVTVKTLGVRLVIDANVQVNGLGEILSTHIHDSTLGALETTPQAEYQTIIDNGTKLSQTVLMIAASNLVNATLGKVS